MDIKPITMMTPCYLIRTSRGYFVSLINGKATYTGDEMFAWSVQQTTENWHLANQVCEDYQRKSGDMSAYVCERTVNF